MVKTTVYIASCFLRGSGVRNLPAMQEMPLAQDTQVQSLAQEDPLRRKWQPTPDFLPGESHAQRGLAGYSPRGPKELDTTERLRFHFHLLSYLKKSPLETLQRIHALPSALCPSKFQGSESESNSGKHSQSNR